MNKTIKVILTCAIILVLVISSFFLGEYRIIKSYENSQTKLDEYISETNNKMNVIQQQNEELLKLNNEQERINTELRQENELMKLDLNNIKSSTNSTKEKLYEIEKSTNNSTSIITQLKENQKIFREYFENISDIIKE